MFSEQQKILIIDDESGIREGLKAALGQMGFLVLTAESGERGLYQLKQNAGISMVLCDFKMPGMTGFDVLREVKVQNPGLKFILMTGFGSVHHAVNAIQLGADDYLCKPFAVSDLERLIQRFRPQVETLGESETLLSKDSHLLAILRKAEKAARSTAPILIEGPSGTGKELLAKQIHEWSPRKDKPWVAINCAALPAGLLESELFGFEKGAFTGALEKKQGRFEQAHGGTLLLDEIGELDPLLQAKLLRVLQEGEVDRLGGKKAIKVDVRIIATTNRNLERLVKEDKFREDLFFRLYGVRFVLPSLSERTEDIEVLAQEFLRRQSKVQSRELVFAESVLASLKQMAWPGNVRELERAIERAAVFSEGGTIELKDFDFSTPELRPRLQPNDLRSSASFERAATRPKVQRSIREMEKEVILSALEANGGNRTHTAKALGMSLRTLRHKIKQYREAGLEEPSRQSLVGNGAPRKDANAELVGLSVPFGAGLQIAPPEVGEIKMAGEHL